MNKVPGYVTTVYQKQVAAFSPWRVGVMLLLQKVNIFYVFPRSDAASRPLVKNNSTQRNGGSDKYVKLYAVI